MQDLAGQHAVQGVVGLQGLELFEGAVEGSLTAGLVARQAIILRVEQVEFRLEDAAQVPGGGDQFVEQGLLDLSAGVNLAQTASCLGSEAVLAGILRTAGLAWFGARAGAGLGVGAVGFDLEFA